MYNTVSTSYEIQYYSFQLKPLSLGMHNNFLFFLLGYSGQQSRSHRQCNEDGNTEGLSLAWYTEKISIKTQRTKTVCAAIQGWVCFSYLVCSVHTTSTVTMPIRLLLPLHTATKIPFIYSFSGNCPASVPIFTFMCLCEQFIYSQDRSTYFPATE